MVSQVEETIQSAPNDAGFVPARMLEVELANPLPIFTAYDEQAGKHYQRALCLVRLHTQPLGMVELFLDEQGERVQEHANAIWQALHNEINSHLQEDDLPVVSELAVTGIATQDTPRCVQEREQFFARAPFASVIVATHDRPKEIAECLLTLLALEYPDYEIVVIDNAPSSAATEDYIKQHYADNPRVRYVREERAGVTWARNTGMRAARAEFLAYTDDDVLIDKYWLLELMRGFEVAADVVCVTGNVLPMELETEAQDFFEQYGGFSKGFARIIFDLKKHRRKHPLYPYLPGGYGTGASMAFKTDYLRQAGGFDPTIDYLGSDAEGLFQAVNHGHKIVYMPAALLRHQHYRSYETLRKQVYRYGIGLTAFLTKCVVTNPLTFFDLLFKIPYGFFFVFSNKSSKNKRRKTNYPKELSRWELKGMLRGPTTYFSRMRAMRRERK
jgi:GT2 family glycosyltransferase